MNENQNTSIEVITFHEKCPQCSVTIQHHMILTMFSM
jgi:hypothetical protein